MPNLSRLQDVISYLVPDYCPELYRGDTPKGRRAARAAIRDAGFTVPRTLRTSADLVAFAKRVALENGYDATTGERTIIALI